MKAAVRLVDGDFVGEDPLSWVVVSNVVNSMKVAKEGPDMSSMTSFVRIGRASSAVADFWLPFANWASRRSFLVDSGSGSMG